MKLVIFRCQFSSSLCLPNIIETCSCFMRLLTINLRAFRDRRYICVSMLLRLLGQRCELNLLKVLYFQTAMSKPVLFSSQRQNPFNIACVATTSANAYRREFRKAHTLCRGQSYHRPRSFCGQNKSTSLLQPLFTAVQSYILLLTCPVPSRTTEVRRHFVRHQLCAIGLVK